MILKALSEAVFDRTHSKETARKTISNASSEVVFDKAQCRNSIEDHIESLSNSIEDQTKASDEVVFNSFHDKEAMQE